MRRLREALYRELPELGSAGRPPKEEAEKGDIITLKSPRGTDPNYALARLKRDRTKLVLTLEDDLKAQAKERQGTRTDLPQNSAEGSFGETRDKMAEAAGVSHDTIDKVRKVEEAAPETIKQKAESGDMTVNAAYEATKALEGVPKDVAEAVANSDVLDDRKQRQALARLATMAR